MFESLIDQLITGGVSGGIIAAAVLAYMRWRLERLEQCIDRAHNRIDQHIDRKVD